MPVATKTKPSGPQRSHLRKQLDRAAKEVQRLQEQVEALEKDRARLQAKADAHAAGLVLADFELQAVVLARLSLGRDTKGLLHQQLQHDCSMAAVPPVESWCLGTRTYISKLPRERLRYLLLTGYRTYNAWLMDPEVFQNPAAVQSMKVWANKVKHVSHCFWMSPATFMSIVDSNLETGESRVPSSVTNRAIASLPHKTLPPGFFEHCRQGLQMFNSQVDSLVKRRFQIGQHVTALLQALPQPAQRTFSNKDSCQQLLNAINWDASMQPDAFATNPSSHPSLLGSTGQPLSLAEASELAELDIACQLEQELQAFEDTMVQEFRTRMMLLEHITQKLPLHYLACYVATCQPYHAYLPATLAALLRMHDCNTKAQQNKRPAGGRAARQ